MRAEKPTRERADGESVKTSVLFLCSANSCRSQIAEGLLRHLAADPVENAVRELPERFGSKRQYDWVSKDSDTRLISYTRGAAKSPALIVWMEGHKANHKCSLLIPIAARQA
jgi:hypothetical protein